MVYLFAILQKNNQQNTKRKKKSFKSFRLVDFYDISKDLIFGKSFFFLLLSGEYFHFMSFFFFQMLSN